MSPRRVSLTIVSTSFLLACGHAGSPPVAPVAAATVGHKANSYLTIAPEVSVSQSAREYEAKQESLDPNADVMAEILAIPPGR